MPKSRVRKSDSNPYRPNVWGMMRDILMNSTNRGQALAGFLGMVLLVAFLRIPPGDITKLFLKTISLFESLCMFGWIIAFLVTIGSVIILKRLRKTHNIQIREMIDALKGSAGEERVAE